MPENSQINEYQWIFNFLKREKHKLFLFAVISMILFFLLMLLVFFSVPNSRFLRQNIRLMLPTRAGISSLPAADGTENIGMDGSGAVYPSGKVFNKLDIISAPVLRKIYDANSLESKISFDDFSKLFSVVNFSIERAILDADFNGKLGKRNLTTVDLQALELEYRQKSAQVDNRIYQVTMERTVKLPSQLAAKILAEVPQTWMELFRQIESGKLPMTSTDEDIGQKLQQDLAQSRLIAVDRATQYNAAQLRLALALGELQGQRSIRLPTGEYLADLTDSLRNIRDYQLNIIQLLVLDSPQLHTGLDGIYVQSRVKAIQRELTMRQSQRSALLESLDILQNREARPSAKGSGNAGGDTTQLNLDSNFLNQVAELFRKDSNNVMRNRISQLNIKYGDQIAELQSEQEYYLNMEKQLDSSGRLERSGGNVVELFNTNFVSMLKNTLALSRKLEAFRKALTSEYASQTFYAPEGEAALVTERAVSAKWLLVVMALSWTLVNMIFIIVLAGVFYFGHPSAKKEA